MKDIIGRIIAPQTKTDPERREIQVERKAEYSKLPSNYPVTGGANSKGIGVTLKNGKNECQASLHRYEQGNFYIGSPRLRQGHGGKEFTDFLLTVGLHPGTEVKIRFDRGQSGQVEISQF